MNIRKRDALFFLTGALLVAGVVLCGWSTAPWSGVVVLIAGLALGWAAMSTGSSGSMPVWFMPSMAEQREEPEAPEPDDEFRPIYEQGT